MPYDRMYIVPPETPVAEPMNWHATGQAIFATPQTLGPIICSPIAFKPIGDWFINWVSPMTDCKVPKQTKIDKNSFLATSD